MERIVALSGSSRPDSYTLRALRVVTDALAANGHQVDLIDGHTLDLSLPGHPPTADGGRLRELVGDAGAVILATPEYHGGYSALTKLIIESLGFPSALQGKPVGLLGVAAGRIGAVKSLEQLRSVCAHTGAVVQPQAVSVAGVQAAFDGARCTDPGVEALLQGFGERLVQFAGVCVRPAVVQEAAVREGSERPWGTSV